jgi:hypothetical protein
MVQQALQTTRIGALDESRNVLYNLNRVSSSRVPMEVFASAMKPGRAGQIIGHEAL